jgi:hypothetical protein
MGNYDILSKFPARNSFALQRSRITDEAFGPVIHPIPRPVPLPRAGIDLESAAFMFHMGT